MHKHATPAILVVGDLMIDHYLWGQCSRISPEAPVQVVDIQRESSLLGGAGNVVNNLLAFGAQVDVASVLGPDATGHELLAMLQAAQAGTQAMVLQQGRTTSRKSRLIAAHQQVVRYDRESKDHIAPQAEAELLQRIKAQLHRYQAVLISDYGKGVVTPQLCQTIIAEAKRLGIKVLIDPKGSDYRKYAGAFLVTPNRKEASQATGIAIANDQALQQAGFQLKNELGLAYAVITLSEEGMAYFGEAMHKIPTRARDVYDVTGAGDTVLAALGFALAQGASMDEACHFANYAAAVVVGKVGSATATLNEVEAYMASDGKAGGADTYLKTREQIAQLAANLRTQGKRIVFTNGCFDVLHLGHVKYLEKAKTFGDVLIVGVNADASVRRLKGPQRPVNPEFDRAYLLAALGAVDYVVIFDEDTPYELIKAIMPDVLVKGGDYKGKQVVGSDLAKEVRLVDFVEGKSTTNIIARMKQ